MAENFDPRIPTQILSARAERSQWPHFLVQTEGQGAPRNFVLDTEKITLGSSPEADIVVDSSEISPRHAIFRRDGEEFVVQDCDSENGLYLNGLRIHSASLRDGDAIQSGRAVFMYHEG